jgi:hypothetical protein
LFLCDKDTFLLDCGKLTPVACKPPSPERPSVMTVTATRPEGHSFRHMVPDA